MIMPLLGLQYLFSWKSISIINQGFTAVTSGQWGALTSFCLLLLFSKFLSFLFFPYNTADSSVQRYQLITQHIYHKEIQRQQGCVLQNTEDNGCSIKCSILILAGTAFPVMVADPGQVLRFFLNKSLQFNWLVGEQYALLLANSSVSQTN